MMEDCLFCKFISREIETEIIFENDKVLAFKDLYPQAKEHYLFIHKNHKKDINEMAETTSSDIQDVFCAIREFTRKNGLEKTGFRIVNNLGRNGGQTIFHAHFHVLGGEVLGSFGR